MIITAYEPLLTIDSSDSMVYTPLRIAGAQYQTLSVAAPSRAASHTNRSLDGMRMAVKDMFDVNGLIFTRSIAHPLLQQLA